MIFTKKEYEMKTILVVEDEAVMCIWLNMMLQRHGFRVTDVSTGEDAVAAVREQHPDAVLMDIRLSGEMDGIEAAGEIQNIQKTPVIFMTGYSDRITQKKAQESGGVAYIVKPLQIDELIKAIETAVGQR